MRIASVTLFSPFFDFEFFDSSFHSYCRMKNLLYVLILSESICVPANVNVANSLSKYSTENRSCFFEILSLVSNKKTKHFIRDLKLAQPLGCRFLGN